MINHQPTHGLLHTMKRQYPSYKYEAAGLHGEVFREQAALMLEHWKLDSRRNNYNSFGQDYTAAKPGLIMAPTMVYPPNVLQRFLSQYEQPASLKQLEYHKCGYVASIPHKLPPHSYPPLNEIPLLEGPPRTITMGYKRVLKNIPAPEKETPNPRKRKLSSNKKEGNAKRRDKTSSNYIGVFFGKTVNAWVARKMVNRVSHHLGYFGDEMEAARAYDFYQIDSKKDKLKLYEKQQKRSQGSTKLKLNFQDSIEEYLIYQQKGEATYFKTKHVKAKAERTSKYIGVCWHKSNRAWKASMVIDKKNTHIGYFGDEEEAARSYDAKAILYKGKDAKLNFPDAQIAVAQE